MYMNQETLDTIAVLLMLTPLMLVPICLIYNMFSTHDEQQRQLFGSVHPDER